MKLGREKRRQKGMRISRARVSTQQSTRFVPFPCALALSLTERETTSSTVFQTFSFLAKALCCFFHTLFILYEKSLSFEYVVSQKDQSTNMAHCCCCCCCCVRGSKLAEMGKTPNNIPQASHRRREISERTTSHNGTERRHISRGG